MFLAENGFYYIVCMPYFFVERITFLWGKGAVFFYLLLISFIFSLRTIKVGFGGKIKELTNISAVNLFVEVNISLYEKYISQI